MIVDEAFRGLYPDKYEGRFSFEIKFSGKFKGYNANVKYGRDKYTFNLSKQWMHVDKDIKIGLIQHLLNRAMGTKIKTTNIDLYDLFLKNIHIAVPKDNVDEVLKKSFERVNDQYFSGMITMPNLVWGNNTVRKLGSYDYGTDTITISTNLAEDDEAIDYVMHHEMLHKKMKFKTSGNKTYTHTKKFKEEEEKFENSKEIEKRLGRVVRHKKRRSFFFS